MALGSAFSQEKHYEIAVDFRVNSSVIDPAFSNNRARLQEIEDVMQELSADTTINIIRISFCGAASPEGSIELNKRLANNRMLALEKIIRSRVSIPDSLVRYDNSYIPWNTLTSLVESSDISYRSEVLDILSLPHKNDVYGRGISDAERIAKLRALDGGRVWQDLNRRYFSRMRNAFTIFVTYKKIAEPEGYEPELAAEEQEILPSWPLATSPLKVEQLPSIGWRPHWYLKTNALGWAAIMTNLAAEADIAKHWSIALPIYWSAWDYFSETINFRTFMVQPEIRYWFKANRLNDGLFLGAHAGLAYYNMAVDGEYRIQDHDGKNPALGGGLSIGYRMPVSRNGRWKMEFAIGAGVYSLHYDKFRNTENGLLTTTVKDTYIGFDNASVSVAYMFNIKQRRNRK